MFAGFEVFSCFFRGSCLAWWILTDSSVGKGYKSYSCQRPRHWARTISPALLPDIILQELWDSKARTSCTKRWFIDCISWKTSYHFRGDRLDSSHTQDSLVRNFGPRLVPHWWHIFRSFAPNSLKCLIHELCPPLPHETLYSLSCMPQSTPFRSITANSNQIH